MGKVAAAGPNRRMRPLLALSLLLLLGGCIVAYKGLPAPAPFLYNPEPNPTRSLP